MNSTTLNTDYTVSGFQVATCNDLFQGDDAHGRSRQIKAVDDIFKLGSFTAGN